MDNHDFRNRYGQAALVTGASSGIGKSFVELLAARGLDLVLVARRTHRLRELAARLETECHVNVTVCAADLSDAAAPRQILDATVSLDIGLVVSNAGFGMKGEYAACDPAAMADMQMVNCNAPMQLAHGFIPRLRKRGKGGIIFTSSIEALMGCPYSTAYSATKALVSALGESLWAELQPAGIDVLTLCPGATESESAGLQGIDISSLQHVMPSEEVARLTLDNIRNGPVFFSSGYYRANFEKLLSMPRRDALTMMAKAMKK